MKSALSMFALVLAVFILHAEAQARDFGDHDCQIFVSTAGNEITGGAGNELNARVAVAKKILQKDFRNFEVKIAGSDSVKPSKVEEHGNYMVFLFDRYTKGIEYHGNSASVDAYVTNGIDRLFDNNDNVYLTREFNWQYTSPRCHE